MESALCYGWIDGQKQAESDKYWLQRFTPRSAKSIWSKLNKDRAEALIAAGRMRPPGMCEIEKVRAARTNTLPIPRQLLLLNLLDQAHSVVRGAACALTLRAQSDCDADEDGIVALRSTSTDALRGLCQAALALLADRISEVGEGIEAAAAAAA